MYTREDYLKGQEASGIRVGDKVIVTREAIRNEKGWDNGWVTPMNKAIGSVFEVLGVVYEHGITLRVGGETFNFPCFVLEKVMDKKKQSSERFYDDCGVELLPGDVVKVSENSFRVFKRKEGDSYFIGCDESGLTMSWSCAEFYARPPAKQKYVRSRKEVAQILLDDGFEPNEHGTWKHPNTRDAYGYALFKDCGKKLSDCACPWEEKFLLER